MISKPLRLALAITFSLVPATSMFAEQSPLESSNTIDLNGLTYTVTRIFHTNRILTKAKDGESYVVVNFKVKNPKPVTVTHDAEFQILDSEGVGYDMDGMKTVYSTHGFYETFKIMPKSSKFVTLVFTVPKESLSPAWTLAIQNKDDEGGIAGYGQGRTSDQSSISRLEFFLG